mmetsp:Transcript_5236/g.16803  ORF Transcript_5236/g.16803 Transcript_5236/m.16803 type:complete len:253 (+) Transcript_5236:56-814(+)
MLALLAVVQRSSPSSAARCAPPVQQEGSWPPRQVEKLRSLGRIEMPAAQPAPHPTRANHVPAAGNRAYARARREARAAAQEQQRSFAEWASASGRSGRRGASPVDMAPAELHAPEVVAGGGGESGASKLEAADGGAGGAGGPLAPEIVSGGASGVLGFSCGRACRAAEEAAALGLGAAFVCATLLSRAGYVAIDHSKVEKDLVSLLDHNKDGRIDRDDYAFALRRVASALGGHGVSSSAGFAAGFVLGFMGH